MKLEEPRVIAVTCGDNTDAFEEMIEQYEMPITRFMYRLTGDYSLAQDLVRNTFVRAQREMLPAAFNLSLKTWLYRIAADIACQNNSSKRLLSFLPFSGRRRESVTPGQVDKSLERETLVQNALMNVAYDQRLCLVLHIVEGLKYREIGEILGIPRDAVHERIAKGSQAFNKKYSSLLEGKKK